MPLARILRPVTGANGHVYQIDEIVDVSEWKWAKKLELQQKIKIYDDPERELRSASGDLKNKKSPKDVK